MGRGKLERTRCPFYLLRAAALLLPFRELRRDRCQQTRESAERRAALDVEAFGAREAVGEARPQSSALPFGLEGVVARLQGVAEVVQVFDVRVVVDELRRPLAQRGSRCVRGARLERATALRRVDHALDHLALAARHEDAADERVLKRVPLLALDASDTHALIFALGRRTLLVRGELRERAGERILVAHAEDDDAARVFAGA